MSLTLVLFCHVGLLSLGGLLLSEGNAVGVDLEGRGSLRELGRIEGEETVVGTYICEKNLFNKKKFNFHTSGFSVF